MSTTVAKLIIYRAFVDNELDAPKHLARRIHELYFNPQYEEFEPRTLWSLSNAFTSGFKEMGTVRRYIVTPQLAGFVESARLS